MSLIRSNTKWVLFLSSSEPDPEDRHIQDLVYGLMCLESAGISPQNIAIYVDGQNRQNIRNLFSIATANQYSINTADQFFIDLHSNSHDNLVMFVTGHGSESGIDAPVPITPFMLLDALKSAPALDKAIVYLGQCYAGVFNYVNAGRGRGQTQQDPDVILIGATNLYESLSSSTQEQFPNGNLHWVANLFLLHVFRWISAPHDIDGDGRNTIMDSYKYAGVGSNRHNKQSKTSRFGQMVDTHALHKQAIQAANVITGNPQTDSQNQLRLMAVRTQYYNLLNVNYIHQECWILNSYPAQQIEI
ncbi:hypothetical protein [Citrobacter werkmanii]|uniref:hypothetical protein n=1 Tax=Citrobacter werkmanii TaxID=67827 RepID=UPI001D0B33FB|nr:hypothetical protein [Citrobacter werkmanii]MBY6246203.1 hypothetical protein [Citrobacter werkmanii]MBY6254440.1 hypothetical protein [Citrobacter werkmanii]